MSVKLKIQAWILMLSMALLLCLGMGGLLFYLKKGSQRIAQSQTEREMQVYCSQLVRDIYSLCYNTDALFKHKAQGCFKLINYLSGNDTVSPTIFGRLLPEPQNWTAINQFQLDQLPRQVQLNKMEVGKLSFSAHQETDLFSPLVDRLYALTGATVSLFQRMNQEGDMIRVASRLRTPTGKAATGVYLPATHPNGATDPVISQILAGKNSSGRGFILDGWYTYTYKPILDPYGQVIGMAFVGFDASFMENLRNSLMNTKFGNRGHVWVIYTGQFPGDPYAGELVISSRLERSSQGVYYAQDAQGSYFIQDICQSALKLSPYQVHSKSVYLKTSPNRAPGNIWYTYFKEWNWVIGVELPDQDLIDQRSALGKKLKTLFLGAQALYAGFAFTLLGALGLVGRSLFRQQNQIWSRLKLLAQKDKGIGDFNQDRSPQTSSPLLCREAQEALQNLGQIAYYIQTLRLKNEKLKYHLNDVLANLSETQNRQTHFIEATQNAHSQLQIHTQQLLQGAKGIINLSENLEELTPGGSLSEKAPGAKQSGKLTEIEGLIRTIALNAQGMYGRLQTIGTKVTKIGTMVQTINKVSDKTNLLSFNAAIEAHKAQEKGLGLSVIAEEIRQFSDQAALINIDIQQNAQEIEHHIATALQDMDAFIKEIQAGLGQIKSIELKQDFALNQLQGLRSRFQEITQEAKLQAAHAAQIIEISKECKEKDQQKDQSLEEVHLMMNQVKLENLD